MCIKSMADLKDCIFICLGGGEGQYFIYHNSKRN